MSMTVEKYQEIDHAVRQLETKFNWYPIAEALYHELLDEYLKIKQESVRLHLTPTPNEVF